MDYSGRREVEMNHLMTFTIGLIIGFIVGFYIF